MPPKIEQCAEEDIPLIRNMANLLLASEKCNNPAALQKYFEAIDTSDEIKYTEYHKALVDGIIAGIIRIDLDLDGTDKPCGNISSLYVQEKYRGTSLGHKLLTYAVEVCRVNNCSGVTIGVSTNNERANRLYDSFGFKEYHRSLILEL